MFRWAILLGFIVGFGAGITVANAQNQTPTPGATVSFQGQVNYQVSYSLVDYPVTVSYFIQNQKFRADSTTAEGTYTMISDYGAQQMWIVMPAEQIYMTSPIPTPTNASSAATFQKTSNTQVILGHQVTEWDYQDTNVQGVFWMATDMGPLPGFVGVSYSSLPSSIQQAIATGLFPLEVQWTDSSESPAVSQTVMTATQIQSETLDPSVFQPPAGYKQFPISTQFASEFSTGKTVITSPVTIGAH